MKKLTLALLLALCGARVYGQLPQEEAAVNAEQLQVLNAALETAMKDTKSVEAVCQELGLPKEEVKGWFARHKVLTGTGCSLLGVYATLLALSYCGQEAEYKDDKLTKKLGNLEVTAPATKMIKVRNALSKLAWAQKPVAWGQAGFEKAKNNKGKTAALIVGAIVASVVLYDLCHGKDSAIVAGVNKLFGKKEVAPATSEVAQPTTEEAAKEEVAPATTEVVAPTVA